MGDKKWDNAVQLRGVSFKRNLETYRMLTKINPPKTIEHKGYRLAVMHCGAPCCGWSFGYRFESFLFLSTMISCLFQE